MFEVSAAQRPMAACPPHEREMLAAAVDACARLRGAQTRLVALLRREGLVTDPAYTALLARGDQVDAAIATLRARCGVVAGPGRQR